MLPHLCARICSVFSAFPFVMCWWVGKAELTFRNSLKSVRHTVILNYHICSVACKLRCCLTYVHGFVPFSQHSLLLCVDGWEKLSWRLRFYFTKDIIENEREKGNFGEITIEFLQRVSFCAKWNRMRMTGKLIFLIEKTLKYGWAIHFCK